MPKTSPLITKNKKKTGLLPVLAIVGTALAVVLSFFVTWRKQIIRKNLNQIITTEWQNYTSDKPNFSAGVAMQIISRRGNYFISTGMGDIDNNIHFRPASVSKTFTSAAVMLLNQQGKLNITDKIVDKIPGKDISYVPETADYNIPYKKDITIRELLMHRAGVYDIDNSDVPVPGKDYISYIEKTDPNHTFTFDELVGVDAKYHLSFFAPGQDYHYSDTGYSLLGKIIERVSGKSYADFIREAFLVPNGLNDTTVVYNGSDDGLPSPFARGFEWTDGKLTDVTKSNMSSHVAEGSVVTTPQDLAAWAERLYTGQAGLTEETVRMMMDACTSAGNMTESNVGYGYGIMCSKSGFGHSGAHPGYLTNMVYNSETGVAYVIFTNGWNTQSFGKGTLDSLTGEMEKLNTIAQKVLSKLGY